MGRKQKRMRFIQHERKMNERDDEKKEKRKKQTNQEVIQITRKEKKNE